VTRFFRRRIVEPLARQVTQGVAPGRLATAVALGLAVGTMPLLGVTTLLCAGAGVALRLNQPALQVANYAAYPLQLALLVPFFRAGARLFGAAPPSFTGSEISARFARDPWDALAVYGAANLRAVVVWALVAPAAAVLLRVALRPLLARLRPAPGEARS
jgi:uncharacterized protein (DUF2062 family)